MTQKVYVLTEKAYVVPANTPEDWSIHDDIKAREEDERNANE